MGRELGFETEIVEPICAALTDQTVVRVSSTVTRELLRLGRVRDAAAALGRPYELAGSVVQGDRRGRSIGFPTANLECECTPPGDGVYACLATLPSGVTVAAAVNIGDRPTFSTDRRTVEAHLLDPPLNPDQGQPMRTILGCNEYHWPLTLAFIAPTDFQKKAS